MQEERMPKTQNRKMARKIKNMIMNMPKERMISRITSQAQLGKFIIAGRLVKMVLNAEVLTTCVNCNRVKRPATNPISLVAWSRCKEL